MARDDWPVNKQQYMIPWELLPVVGHTVSPGSDDPCDVEVKHLPELSLLDGTTSYL